MKFTHLHVHSQYSILDGAASIKGLVSKAKSDGMTALALTDHGTMYGAKLFYDTCRKEKIKPIIGLEAYVARRSLKKKQEPVDRSGEHLIVIAKNHTGYKNLMKLCSISSIEGFYYRPRIDKKLLAEYREGLIVSSACLGGEISQKIMAGDCEGARNAARWYKEILGEDYYLEVMRHPTEHPRLKKEVYENQLLCCDEILKIGEELDIKVIATNDTHFLNREDAEAHDILICLNTRKDIDDPNRMQYTRQEWLKTTEEMEALFRDIPHVLENTAEIAEKVEEYQLDSNPIMPVFPIPEEFGNETAWKEKYGETALIEEFGRERYEKLGGEYYKILRIKLESDYLKKLTDEGAAERWPDISEEIRERLDFELQTIKTMGFPGYFLIVQDFIRAAREMGVIVGPGRGSAAGSAVAYCLKITNIDPIKYGLLFERFLNPDRISMPDIDIDFDDEGRQKVLDWVAHKYGQNKVAHIITFGSMAAKMAIKDVARVLKVDISEANRLAKLVPEAPKMTLEKAFKQNEKLLAECESPNPIIRKTLNLAGKLDGTIRQTGVHACGILISRDPLTDHIPVIPTEGEELLTTQYDGHFVENIGLLKMDFLGLRTLSIIKTCLDNIRISKNTDIDIDAIPIDDKETFELFSKGETTGLFQFESPGMKKHLRDLKPNRFDDLVAMNALYRPGPMEYIPTFIRRKHGLEPIAYDHPMMEPFLKNTYGITVYQEQVMLQSRALGQFTRGMSDTLRKAMGKKQLDTMEKLKASFVSGCKNNPEFMKGCSDISADPDKLIPKIWNDWVAFASYAFNKSHSVCYAYIAYQTGYLKAHFPAEFMAANLSNNLSQIEKVTVFMDECRRMGIKVLPPDVNESFNDFTVNAAGQIRFGMAAIKGMGEKAAESIISERNKNGKFKNVFDLFERLDYRCINRKSMESLISSGGLDSFDFHRAQYFQPSERDSTVLDTLINFGQKKRSESASFQNSLFGDEGGFEVILPKVPPCEPWSALESAKKEKEYIGIYLTSHPLDPYKMEIEALATPLSRMGDLEELKNKEIRLIGIVVDVREGRTKTNKEYGILTIEDFSETYEIPFFGKTYINYRNYFIRDSILYIKGKVGNGWKDESELRFTVSSMELLSEVRDNLIKNITIEVNINKLNPGDINEVYDKFTLPFYEGKNKKHKGIPLQFILSNEEKTFENGINEMNVDEMEEENDEDETEESPELPAGGENPKPETSKSEDKYKFHLKMRATTCKLRHCSEMYEYFQNNDAFKLKIN